MSARDDKAQIGKRDGRTLVSRLSRVSREVCEAESSDVQVSVTEQKEGRLELLTTLVHDLEPGNGREVKISICVRLTSMFVVFSTKAAIAMNSPLRPILQP